MLGRETKLGARLECLAGFSGRAGACNEIDSARDSKGRFYPLNYGNNDLQRINGLNCDGQERRCDAQRFLGALLSTLGSLFESILASGISM